MYIRNPKLLFNDDYINCCQTFERFSKREHVFWLLSPYSYYSNYPNSFSFMWDFGFIFPQDTNLYLPLFQNIKFCWSNHGNLEDNALIQSY